MRSKPSAGRRLLLPDHLRWAVQLHARMDIESLVMAGLERTVVALAPGDGLERLALSLERLALSLGRLALLLERLALSLEPAMAALESPACALECRAASRDLPARARPLPDRPPPQCATQPLVARAAASPVPSPPLSRGRAAPCSAHPGPPCPAVSPARPSVSTTRQKPRRLASSHHPHAAAEQSSHHHRLHDDVHPALASPAWSGGRYGWSITAVFPPACWPLRRAETRWPTNARCNQSDAIVSLISYMRPQFPLGS